MPASIPGFEYDIFISYRQKDNRGDHWVTEFVNALKTELEATFKEDITIYFDENAHDGLLETHDVDDSLKSKLNCLIFIPIISQTYCDPKSFAWNHEFLAFKKTASEDPFGLKMKLPSGNVASRVLPLRIHEIDPADQKMLEDELQGKLRAIDFTYHSAGVNRPLTPSDNPEKNLNKTFYRDQINKVANVVKEIIAGLKNFDNRSEEPLSKPSHHRTRLPERIITPRKQKILALTSLATLIVLLAGYFVFNFTTIGKRFHPPLDKSIAVLPFTDMSQNKDQEYYSDGLTEDIIAQLAKIKSFKVISRTSVMRYKQNPKPLKEVGDELGVAFILEGSVQRSGDQVRITAQLIKAATDEHLWTESYDRPMDDIFTIQREVAMAIASVLRTTLSEGETQRLNKPPTANLEAYDLYIHGKFLMERRTKPDNLEAREFFDQAVKKDSTFAIAFSALADTYLLSSTRGYEDPHRMLPLAKRYIDKALALDPAFGETQASLGFWNVQNFDFSVAEAILRKALKSNPNQSNGYNWLAYLLEMKGEYAEALEIYDRGIEVNPMWSLLKRNKVNCLVSIHKPEEAIRQSIQLIESNSYDPGFQKMLYSFLARLYWILGRKEEASAAAEKAEPGSIQFYRDGDNSILIKNVEDHYKELANRGEYISQAYMGMDYAKAGERKKAMECFNKAIAMKDPAILLPLRELYYYNVIYEDPDWVRKKIRALITF